MSGRLETIDLDFKWSVNLRSRSTGMYVNRNGKRRGRHSANIIIFPISNFPIFLRLNVDLRVFRKILYELRFSEHQFAQGIAVARVTTRRSRLYVISKIDNL